jgi:predicted acylesterase/phospholipase RssA
MDKDRKFHYVSYHWECPNTSRGGSLGAFGCGVFKALVNNNIKIDIIAGTSIGGVNAAIVAGTKDGSSPEQFWLELAENSVDVGTSFADWLFGYHLLKERLTS